MVRTSIRILIFSSAFVFASGCLTPQSDAVTGLIAATAATTVANSAGGDIYMNVDTGWEGNDAVLTRHGTCSVATGATARTTTCQIHIPEGQLYFSKTKISFGTGNPNLCARVQFIPAFYQASTDAAWLEYWNGTPTAKDCSGAGILAIPTYPALPVGEPECFWGAARLLYSNWPETMGKYFQTVSSGLNESSETVPSMNSLTSLPLLDLGAGQYTQYNTGVTNTVNNPATTITTGGGVQTYIANTMQPYRARCLDAHEQVMAEVLVYIADQDLEAGEDPASFNNDQYYDWAESL